MPRSPSPRPGVATSYLKAAADEFEHFAGSDYAECVCDASAPPESVLAGLRYIATRKRKEHHPKVKEALTITRTGSLAEEIQLAGIEALLATSDDAVKTGRFLAALAGDQKRPQMADLGAYGLRQLGPAGRDAILEELQRDKPVAPPKKLARILMNMSTARPPVPIGFWSDASPAQRAEAAETWRTTLRDKGEL